MIDGAIQNLTIGHEIEPVTYVITRESIATYSRYVFDGRDTRNIHTDDEVAQRAGLPRAVAQGRYPVGYMSERALAFFGAGWVQGGRLDVTLIKPIYPGDSVTVRGVITGGVSEGDGTRLTLDIWLENQHGERVTAGCASGLVPVNAKAGLCAQDILPRTILPPHYEAQRQPQIGASDF